MSISFSDNLIKLQQNLKTIEKRHNSFEDVSKEYNDFVSSFTKVCNVFKNYNSNTLYVQIYNQAECLKDRINKENFLDRYITKLNSDYKYENIIYIDNFTKAIEMLENNYEKNEATDNLQSNFQIFRTIFQAYYNVNQSNTTFMSLSSRMNDLTLKINLPARKEASNLTTKSHFTLGCISSIASAATYCLLGLTNPYALFGIGLGAFGMGKLVQKGIEQCTRPDIDEKLSQLSNAEIYPSSSIQSHTFTPQGSREKIDFNKMQRMGLANGNGTDCFLNSSLQAFFLNDPELFRLFQDYGSEVLEITQFLLSYQNEQPDSRILRRGLAKISNGQISSNLRQEDAHEAIHVLLDKIIEDKKALSSSMIGKLTEYRKYEIPIGVSDQILRNSFDKVYQNGAARIGLRKSGEHDDFGEVLLQISDDHENQYYDSIRDRFQGKVKFKTLDFNERFINALDYQSEGENALIGGMSLKAIGEKKIWTNAPRQLMVQNKLFDQSGNKKHSPMNVPETFYLPQRFVQNSFKDVTYSLSSFIVHHGKSSNSGHYIAYTNESDGWYYYNDIERRKIDFTNPADKQQFEQDQSYSYIAYFRKVEDMDIHYIS